MSQKLGKDAHDIGQTKPTFTCDLPLADVDSKFIGLPPSLMDVASVQVTSGIRPRKPVKTPHSAPSAAALGRPRSGPSTFKDPMVRFLELILPWKILHDHYLVHREEIDEDGLVVETKLRSPFPLGPAPVLTALPTVFSSGEEYLRTWEPLWVLETKAKIATSLPSLSKPPRLNSGSLNWKYSYGADADAPIVSLDIVLADVEFTPMDALILSAVPISNVLAGISTALGTNSMTATGSGAELSAGTHLEPYAFALVHSFARCSGGRLHVSTATFSELLRSASFTSLPAKSSSSTRRSQQQLYYVLLSNIRSDCREFFSLYELANGNIPLSDEILGIARTINMPSTPEASAPPALVEAIRSSCAQESTVDSMVDKWDIPGIASGFLQHLKSKFNPSQLNAIRSSVDHDGFTLIQGPPGTGKTSTILGLLNALHVREYDTFYKLALEALLGPEGQRCRAAHMEKNTQPWLNLISKLSVKKPRLLVTAPANVAVDNIIERILTDGFVDGSGKHYKPNILRVGPGSGIRVNCVSLEHTLEQERLAMHDSESKQLILEGIRIHIGSLLNEMFQMQTLLLNLRFAHDAHPLPEGWELRIAVDSGQPYFVDHINKCTSSRPPPPPPLPTVRHRKGVESIAEYRIFSHKLTQLFEAVDVLNLKRLRIQAALNQDDHAGGRSGDGQKKQEIESSIIDGAQIMFATLNSTGHGSLAHTEYCVVVVDEAAQCVEPSLLIALRRGCKRCILVGDQRQLPATIFSKQVQPTGYARSLFERLIDAGHPYLLLDTQYRMHPSISAFPSANFYGGKLKDGSNVQQPEYLPVFLQETQSQATLATSEARLSSSTARLLPFMFFNLANSYETARGSMSKANTQEAIFCLNILRLLHQKASETGRQLGSVGIVTPYSEQVNELRTILRQKANELSNQNYAAQALPASSLDMPKRRRLAEPPPSGNQPGGVDFMAYSNVEISTVDGFQGKEKDIIIMSTVRANEHGNIGFLADRRRMNVAVTRSKFCLFVVGSRRTLQYDKLWRELIDHAEATGVLVDVERAHEDVASLLGAIPAISTGVGATDSHTNGGGGKSHISTRIDIAPKEDGEVSD